MRRAYRMTPARMAAIRKAQAASAAKRRGTGKKKPSKGAAKRYSSRRGSFARKTDALDKRASKNLKSKSKRKNLKGAAQKYRAKDRKYTLSYAISKQRGKKAGKTKRYSSKRGKQARDVDAFNSKTKKLQNSKSRAQRAVGHTRRALAAGNTKTIGYQVSKRRGKKAGQIKRKRRKT